MALRWLFLLAFAAVASIGFFWALRDRRRFFEFPAIFAIAHLLYLLPQAVAGVMDEQLVPLDACCLTLFHATNCLFLAYMGYFQYKTPPLHTRIRYDSSRLFQVGAFWSMVGVGGFLALDLYVYGGLLNAYSHEKGRYTVELTGTMVYLSFISRLILPGMMLIIIAMIAKTTKMRVLVLAITLLYPMMEVVLGGRRFLLAMIIAAFLFPIVYVQRKFPPIWVMLVGMVVMMGAVIILPAVRTEVGIDKGYDAVFELDLDEEIAKAYRADQCEFPYHMRVLSALAQTGYYGWGLDFYNSLAKQYIPRGIVGKAVKEAFLLPGANPEGALAETGFRGGKYYLAEPAIIDSFFEFSFAGCLLFFFAGRTFRHMWDRAMRDRDIRFIMISCLLGWLAPYIAYGGFMSAMNRLIPMLFVIFTADWYARVREPRRPVFQRRVRGPTF